MSNTPFLGFQPVFGALKQHVHALFEEELVAVKEASTLTEALVIARYDKLTCFHFPRLVGPFLIVIVINLEHLGVLKNSLKCVQIELECGLVGF